MVQGALAACSRLGKWWYCSMYLQHVMHVSSVHMILLWSRDPLLHLPPSHKATSPLPAAEKGK